MDNDISMINRLPKTYVELNQRIDDKIDGECYNLTEIESNDNSKTPDVEIWLSEQTMDLMLAEAEEENKDKWDSIDIMGIEKKINLF